MSNSKNIRIQYQSRPNMYNNNNNYNISIKRRENERKILNRNLKLSINQYNLLTIIKFYSIQMDMQRNSNLYE